jgi:glycosyltransferase involved in cell wall biosynthesis
VTTVQDPTVIVVPCFNEEHRLDPRAFLGMAATHEIHLLFVDDGSTDGTGRVLSDMSGASDGIEVFTLARNTGKAEAVRRGLLVALRGGAATVGYYDADLATPPEELLRLTRVLHARPDLTGVFGSRVARLGSSIERKAVRRHLGRAYATVASMALGITVYDTQCGAKVFRVNDAFVAALAEPFRSSWAFDVELLYRLLRGGANTPGVPVASFVEVPLEAWRDVPGSNVRVAPALSALFNLVAIARDRTRPDRSRAGSEVGATASVMVPSSRRRSQSLGAPTRAGSADTGEERA